MARIFIAVVVAVLLFGGVLAADQMLQNPDVEPADNATADKQQQFVEATTPFIEIGVPLVVLTLTIGAAFSAIRVVGG